MRSAGAGCNEEPTLIGKRVVIVEDEGVTQMQLRRALVRAGLQVAGAAANGRDGVTMVLEQKPDLVLMDIRMPVLNGLDAAREILSERAVCIVMLTAFSDEDNQNKAREIGTCGYIVKPVTGDMLIPLLQKAYGLFQGRE